MNIVVNIGNTNTKIALVSNKCKVIASFPSRNFKYGNIAKSIIGKLDIKNIAKAGIVSVIPELTKFWFLELNKFFKENVYVLDGRSNFTNSNLKINYSPKKILGADRIANAVGGVYKFPSVNKIIVDIGTAVTIDAVSNKNIFLGGIIFPGIRASLNSLNAETDLLPKVNFSKTTNPIGTNTKQCMRIGIINQLCGGINYGIDSIKKLEVFNKKSLVVITGGGEKFVRDKLKTNYNYAENLTLEGVSFWLDNI